MSETPDIESENFGRPLDWYHAFFSTAPIDKLTGEITPAYLRDEEAPNRIYDYNPNIKLFAILREPVSGAYSSYLARKHLGTYSYKTFEKAIDYKPELLTRNLYFRHLTRYYERFPAKQIKVLLYDDLVCEKSRMLKELYDFLNVEHHFSDVIDKRSNPGMQSRWKWANHCIGASRLFLHKHKLYRIKWFLKKSGIIGAAEFIRDKKNVRSKFTPPPIDKALEKNLKEYFRSDIENLETLIERDLTAWK
jgi:hypothetical protein